MVKLHTIFSKAYVPPVAHLQPAAERILPQSPPIEIEIVQNCDLPSLPTELVIRIIEASLPLVETYDSFPLRSKLLRGFCVDSRWREISQDLLFRSPVLSTPAAADELATILRNSKFLGNRVRTLRFGRGLRVQSRAITWEDSSSVIAVLQLCGFVEELTLNGIKALHYGQLLAGKQLKSLTLFDCDFVERWHLSPVVLPLPITRLSIRGSRFGSEETAVTFARTLTNLTTLAMDSGEFSLPFFTTLAPQLRALSIRLDPDTDWTSTISSATALNYLEIRDAIMSKLEAKSFLDQITTVQHLQVAKFSSRTDSLHFLSALTTFLVEDGLPALRAIYLPRGFALKRKADDDGRGAEASLPKIRRSTSRVPRLTFDDPGGSIGRLCCGGVARCAEAEEIDYCDELSDFEGSVLEGGVLSPE